MFDREIIEVDASPPPQTTTNSQLGTHNKENLDKITLLEIQQKLINDELAMLKNGIENFNLKYQHNNLQLSGSN